jgi:hypothetical protein
MAEADARSKLRGVCTGLLVIGFYKSRLKMACSQCGQLVTRPARPAPLGFEIGSASTRAQETFTSMAMAIFL